MYDWQVAVQWLGKECIDAVPNADHFPLALISPLISLGSLQSDYQDPLYPSFLYLSDIFFFSNSHSLFNSTCSNQGLQMVTLLQKEGRQFAGHHANSAYERERQMISSWNDWDKEGRVIWDRNGLIIWERKMRARERKIRKDWWDYFDRGGKRRISFINRGIAPTCTRNVIEPNWSFSFPPLSSLLLFAEALHTRSNDW